MTLTHAHARLGTRILVAACVAVGLFVAALALDAPRTALGNDGPGCEPADLGQLGAEAQAAFEVNGRWTTEDCDSRFRAGSDAHTYRIELAEPGRVRIDLTSAEGDSYLYLMAEDGSRLAEDDDGNNILNSRIERELAAGVYLIEATTVGGRERGATDFALSIELLTECGPIELGELTPDADLTASGSWGLETCASQFLKDHPAVVYIFTMPQGGLVRIDLTSPTGDPVLAVVAVADGIVVDANDDGAGFRNSRVERYLTPGDYTVETTTYRERGIQPLSSDFELVIHLVDEEAERGTFNLKIEASHTPDQVIAGEPFTVHYRAGNLGGGDLTDAGGYAVLYVVAPGASDRTRAIYGSAERWQAGVSYHSGSQTATATSIVIDEAKPFTLTLNRPGPSFVFVAAVVFDEADEEIGFHGIWRDLEVLSGPTFDPRTVNIDGMGYTVSATADADSQVTVSVNAIDDSGAGVAPAQRAKAIYTAGVQALLLAGIGEREAIAALEADRETRMELAEPTPFSVTNASSTTLHAAFVQSYESSIAASGLAVSVAAGEVVIPAAVEDLALATADAEAARYSAFADAWAALRTRLDDGEALTFEEALALHADLAYAESIAAPAVTAGAIVKAARAAEAGWLDPAVTSMVRGLQAQASCSRASLRDALQAAGVDDIDTLLALDAELRAVVPVHGLATDAALCAAAEIDATNSAFLQSLTIAGSDVHGLLAPEPTPAPVPEPVPHRLRIVARLADDGRIEHGVELANGDQILPTRRFLNAEPGDHRWRQSSAVEVDGSSIGLIHARRLADGRVEFLFRGIDGSDIEPDIRHLPAELPLGVWLRSNEIEVPPAPPAEVPDE